MDDPRLDEYIDKIDYFFNDKIFEGVLKLNGNVICNQLDCTAFIIQKGTSLRSDIINIAVDDGKVEIESDNQIDLSDKKGNLRITDIIGNFLIFKFGFDENNKVETSDIVESEDDNSLDPLKFTLGLLPNNLLQNFNLDNVLELKSIPRTHLSDLLINNIVFDNSLNYSNVASTILKPNLTIDELLLNNKLNIENIVDDIQLNDQFYNFKYDKFIDNDISFNFNLFKLYKILNNTNQLLNGNFVKINNFKVQVNGIIIPYYSISGDITSTINTNNWNISISNFENENYTNITFDHDLNSSEYNDGLKYLKLQRKDNNAFIKFKNAYEKLFSGYERHIYNSNYLLGKSIVKNTNTISIGISDISYISISGNFQNNINNTDWEVMISNDISNNYNIIGFNFDDISYSQYIKISQLSTQSNVIFKNEAGYNLTLSNNFYSISGYLFNLLLPNNTDPYNLTRSRDPSMNLTVLRENIVDYTYNNSSTINRPWIYFWNNNNINNKFYPYENADKYSVKHKYSYNYTYKINNTGNLREPPELTPEKVGERYSNNNNLYSNFVWEYDWTSVAPISGILIGDICNNNVTKFTYIYDNKVYDISLSNDVNFKDNLLFSNSSKFNGLLSDISYPGYHDLSNIKFEGDIDIDNSLVYIPDKYLFNKYYPTIQTAPETISYDIYIERNKFWSWNTGWPKTYDISYQTDDKLNHNYYNEEFNSVSDLFKEKYNLVEVYEWRKHFPINVPDFPDISNDGNPIFNLEDISNWSIWGDDSTKAFNNISEINKKDIFIDTVSGNVLINDKVLSYISVSGDGSFNNYFDNLQVFAYNDINYTQISNQDWNINTYLEIRLDESYIRIKNTFNGREYWDRIVKQPDSNHIVNKILDNESKGLLLWKNIFSEISDKKIKKIINTNDLYKNCYDNFILFKPISYNLIYNDVIKYGFNAQEIENISKELISSNFLTIKLNLTLDVSNNIINLKDVVNIEKIKDIIILITIDNKYDVLIDYVNDYKYKLRQTIDKTYINITSIYLKNIKTLDIKQMFYTGLGSYKYLVNKNLNHNNYIKKNITNDNSINNIIKSNDIIINKIKNKLNLI